MSIFNGDSIYKSGAGGAGGGGYSDGGALVDADFIKVENNTVSSYDNVSRDPINLYFEPKDGEIINSIVELTTAVNATVNVYVVKNGFYYLLGNVGGNTVNAGDDYKINVIGDSFSIEQVSSLPVPEYAVILGFQYKLLKVGDVYWICSDLKGSSFEHYETANTCYYKLNKNINIDGWRLPKKEEVVTLNNTYSFVQLRSNTGWPSGYEGNDQSGFSAKAYGQYNKPNNSVQLFNWASYLMSLYNDNVGFWRMDGYDNYAYGGGDTNYWVPIRLVHDV